MFVVVVVVVGGGGVCYVFVFMFLCGVSDVVSVFRSKRQCALHC